MWVHRVALLSWLEREVQFKAQAIFVIRLRQPRLYFVAALLEPLGYVGQVFDIAENRLREIVVFRFEWALARYSIILVRLRTLTL